MTASSDPRPGTTLSYDAPRTPISLVGNRIQPPVGKRAAPRHPPCRQHRSLDRPVNADRVKRVGRARGVEPAAAGEQLAEGDAVEQYASQQNPPEGRR